MTKTKNKILSFVLAVCMALALTPIISVTVWASGAGEIDLTDLRGTTHSGQDANGDVDTAKGLGWTYAHNNGIGSTLEIGTGDFDITGAHNSITITVNGSDGDTVSIDATIAVPNSANTVDGGVAVTNNGVGSIKITDGSITGGRGGVGADGGAAVINASTGSIEVTGGSINGGNSYFVSGGRGSGGSGVVNSDTGHIEIAGGSIKGGTGGGSEGNGGSGGNGVVNSSTGSIDITGGDITGGIGGSGGSSSTAGTGGNGVVNLSGSIKITNGSVKGGDGGNNSNLSHGGSGGTGVANSGGSIEITNSSVQGGCGGTAIYHDTPNGTGGTGGTGMANSGGSIEITSSSISGGTGGTGSFSSNGGNGIIISDGGTVEITGGTVAVSGGNGNGYGGNGRHGVVNNVNGALLLSGGILNVSGGNGSASGSTDGGGGIFNAGTITLAGGALNATGGEASGGGSGGVDISNTIGGNVGTVNFTGEATLTLQRGPNGNGTENTGTVAVSKTGNVWAVIPGTALTTGSVADNNITVSTTSEAATTIRFANTDATLYSVAGETISPGSGAGATNNPITASVSVNYSIASLASGDITPTDSNATAQLYDSGFSSAQSPIALDVGSNDVYIKVTAEDKATVLHYHVTVTRVAAPSVITTHPVAQTVTEGDTATFTVTATGATDYQWQVDSGAGFADVTDGSGETAASYTTPAATLAMNGWQYRVVVTHAGGSEDSNAAALTVNAPPPPTATLTLGTMTNDTAVEGEPYYKSTPYTYQNGTGTLAFSTSDTLPLGISLNSATGEFAGTPQAGTAESYPITVTVSDGTLSDTGSFTLTVDAAPIPPVLQLATPTNDTVTEGDSYSKTFSVTYTDIGTLGYTITGLPSGLTYSTTTGEISGTAQPEGTYNIDVEATDGTLTDTTSFTLTVQAAVYTLTVNNGSGGGSYAAGASVPIQANTAPSGQLFDQWTGDTAALANANAPGTTVTMPAANVTVTATYKSDGGTPPTDHTVIFRLNGGTHTGGGALTQTVPDGGAAVPPTTARSGYTFNGWDKAFSNVTADMTVTAQWTYNGGSSSSDSDSSTSTSDTTPAKTHIPNSAFTWDGDRTLTVNHGSITARGLLKVLWDGVETIAYTARNGSVIIEFTQGFIDAQAYGDHTVRVEFLNHYGEYTVTLAAPESSPAISSQDNANNNPSTGGYPDDASVSVPQTGDPGLGPLSWLWILIPAAVLAGCAGVVVWRRKHHAEG